MKPFARLCSQTESQYYSQYSVVALRVSCVAWSFELLTMCFSLNCFAFCLLCTARSSPRDNYFLGYLVEMYEAF